jgi:hypothetical protein
MEELTGALVDRGMEVADRQNLEFVYKELNFQMSGEVSDEEVVSIGKFLGADMVITGSLRDDRFYNGWGYTHYYRYGVNRFNVKDATRVWGGIL